MAVREILVAINQPYFHSRKVLKFIARYCMMITLCVCVCVCLFLILNLQSCFHYGLLFLISAMILMQSVAPCETYCEKVQSHLEIASRFDRASQKLELTLIFEYRERPKEETRRGCVVLAKFWLAWPRMLKQRRVVVRVDTMGRFR